MKHFLNQKRIAVFVFCAFVFYAYRAKDREITFTNPTSLERADELIVLKRAFVQEKIGRIPAGKYVALTSRNNKPLTVQYDDLDGDGNWDELAFLYSFKPQEKVSFLLSVADAPAAIKAMVRAHARHKRKKDDNTFGDDLIKDSIPAGQPATDFSKQAYPPFLTEGPAWENDKVGFRLYFDVRNGKDIWGKTTTRMMMDNVGLDTASDYHRLADWGMDVLKVGKSLGAGALALQVPLGEGKDTLVRLGGNNMGKVIYEKIADGPVRAIIRFHYPEWKVPGSKKPVSLVEEISIWGGQYFYESKVTAKGIPSDARLITGIVNLHSKGPIQLNSPGIAILYTYDVQSENKDNLGMGIIVSKQDFHSFGASANAGSDIQNTFFVSGNAGKPILFRFYAGWEKTDDRFKAKDGFHEFLMQQSALMKLPVTIN